MLDETVQQALGLSQEQLTDQNGVNPDLFGVLALVAMLTGGKVEYLPENVRRALEEQ